MQFRYTGDALDNLFTILMHFELVEDFHIRGVYLIGIKTGGNEHGDIKYHRWD